jgi:hypothetical protein
MGNEYTIKLIGINTGMKKEIDIVKRIGNEHGYNGIIKFMYV